MRYNEFKLDEDQLFEINMSPSNLRKLSSNIDGRVGMEFEMIVPNVSVGDDGDYENDYSADERINNFDDIKDFFLGGDGNNSRRDVEGFIEKLQEQYWDWLSDNQYEYFVDNGFSFFKDYLEDDFDEEEVIDTARDEVKEANPELDQESEEFNDLVQARLEELKEEWIESEWDEKGDNFHRAYDDWRDDQNDDQVSEWLDSQGYRYMSDLERAAYNESVYWPYQMQTGDEALNDVAHEFSAYIKRQTTYSLEHGGDRIEGWYTVEPDGSLEPNIGNDAGLEFISPTLTLDEMFTDLQNVVEYADAFGCYTGAENETGLHINVSVPNLEGNVKGKLDYIKLAILLGDHHVLNAFGRYGNHYCKSAIDIIKNTAAGNPTKVQQLFAQMQTTLSTEASHILHDTLTSKFTSINTKDGYIEFRSPGGDWLNDLRKDPQKIPNMIMRMVVALDAAVDPEKYKNEYLKKLYKLLNPSGQTDEYGQMIDEFSRYVTAIGGASPETLRGFTQQAIQTLGANKPVAQPKVEPQQPKVEPQQEYVQYRIYYSNEPTRTLGIFSSTPQDALQKFQKYLEFNIPRERHTEFDYEVASRQ